MPMRADGDGLHVVSTSRRLLADPELADAQILVLGRVEREEDVPAALRAGIAGPIDRDASPYELVRAVPVSASADMFVEPSSMRRPAARLDPDTFEE